MIFLGKMGRISYLLHFLENNKYFQTLNFLKNKYLKESFAALLGFT